MKIDPKLINLYESQVGKGIKRSDDFIKKDPKLSSAVVRNDRIEISEKGAKFSEIQAMKSQLLKDIEKASNAEKLYRLQEQIENGTYHVSSSAIADAILKVIR